MRAVESEGAEEPAVVGELRHRRRGDPRAGGRQHRVLPRVRRDAHTGAAHQRAEHGQARPELLPPGELVRRVRPERDQVRRQTEDLDAVRLVPPENRLERVEVRADQLTQTLGRDVRKAQRPSRGRKLRVDARIADPELSDHRPARGERGFIAARAASSNEVSRSGTSCRRRSSRATVALRRPSMSGRATAAFTGVTRCSQ